MLEIVLVAITRFTLHNLVLTPEISSVAPYMHAPDCRGNCMFNTAFYIYIHIFHIYFCHGRLDFLKIANNFLPFTNFLTMDNAHCAFIFDLSHGRYDSFRDPFFN